MGCCLIGGDSMKKYCVIGYFRQAHKDFEAESQFCETYREALQLKEKWIKERKYKEVYIETYR